jgi:hypothetical protein
VSQQKLSDEAYQLGETYGLGTPNAIYRASYSRADIFLFWWQIASSLLTIAVALAFIVALELFHASVARLFLPVLVLFLALNFTNTFRAARRKKRFVYDPFTRNLRVYLYEHGLIQLRATRPVVVRWEEIARVRCSLYQEAARSFQSSIIVDRIHGKPLRFGANIPNIASLCENIERAYRKRKEQ